MSKQTTTEVLADQDEVQLPEPTLVQVRVKPNGRWAEPYTTATEKTALARATYLVTTRPNVYEMRLLYAQREVVTISQPKRQPLTNDEIDELARGKSNHAEFARAIEAAHGIK